MTSIVQAESRPRPPRPPDIQSSFGQVDSKNDAEIENDRPTKRRKLEGDGFLAVKNENKFRVLNHLDAGRIWTANGNSTGLPPLPPRPALNTIPTEDESKPTVRVRTNVVVPNTPDDIGIPKNVPHLGPNKFTGFFPWTGKHPEDILSELHVKNGYFDRPPNPPEKELNTARLPLYNSLKNKSGLEGLSVLLSLILEQKNKQSVGSSVSGFKPPPRVTLTEVKRKSWISDLANPDVPLKKLSRTIPQGIRGQPLLDQCLANAVPLARAIWFVKCVGANEIRSLKRKGTTHSIASGTEAKWLREWTIGTEQFVETILTKTNEPNWKMDVKYVLRLTTHLYADDLLDRDHFLDWILRSLSAANNDHFLFWFFICSIFHRDILMFHRRGRKFVDILCVRYRQVAGLRYGGFPPLTEKIANVLRRIVVVSPRSLLMPDQWPEMKQILQQCLGDLPAKNVIMDRLNAVNQKITGSDRASDLDDSSYHLIKVLDSANAPYDIPSLSDLLKTRFRNPTLLTSSCLKWATTRLRYGVSRIFLITRLIRRWTKEGIEVQTSILDYLNDCRSRPSYYDFDSVRHLMVELFRSKTFSLSHFIQWLAVRKPSPSRQDFEPAQILLDIPMSCAPEHVVNLRNSILERAGFSVEEESNDAKKALGQLASMFEKPPTQNPTHLPDLSVLPWSIRCQISQWMRTRVAALVSKPKNQLQQNDPLTFERFCLIRTALEQMQDYPVLADVIGLLSISQEETTLAALVDTVCRHFQTFSALGALEFLSHRLSSAYLTLRVLKPIGPALTIALQDLCTFFPTKVLSLRLLEQDFAKGDAGRAIAACSPFSNGVAESLEQAGASFTEDFESILQSEPHMNEQTMSSLVNVLVMRIEKELGTSDVDRITLASLVQLLARLRLFRPSQADSFLSVWIRRLSKNSASTFNIVLSQLLSFGVLSPKLVVDSLQKMDNPATLLRNHLKSVSAIDWLKPNAEYRTHTKWLQFAKTNPVQMIDFAGDESNLSTELTCRISVDHPAELQNISKHVLLCMGRKIDDMLAAKSTNVSASDLIDMIDDTSLPLLLTRLYILTRDEDGLGKNTTDLVEALYRFAENQTIPSDELAKVLSSVGTTVVQAVRKKAEEVLQQHLRKCIRIKNTAGGLVLNQDDVGQFAMHVDVVSKLSTDAQSLGFGGVIIEYFSQCLKTFSSCGQIQNGTSTPGPSLSPEASSTLNSVFWEMLEIVLRLTCMKRPYFRNMSSLPGPGVKQMHLEQLRIVVLLASVATHTIWSFLDNIYTDKDDLARARRGRNFILDVTTTMADDLSDEARAFGQTLLKERAKNPIIQSLFGSVNSVGSVQCESAGHGLMVAKEGRGVVGPWKPKVWEILDNASGKEEESCLGLGLFEARRG